MPGSQRANRSQKYKFCEGVYPSFLIVIIDDAPSTATRALSMGGRIVVVQIRFGIGVLVVCCLSSLCPGRLLSVVGNSLLLALGRP